MKWLTLHNRGVLIGVMTISLAIAFAFSIHAGSQLRYEDERQYVQLATNLIHLHSYSLDGTHATAIRPPGYAWFLSVPLLLGFSNVGLRLVNACTLPVCQIFLFLLVRKLGPAGAAPIAVILSLIYPIFLFTAAVLFPQSLGAALLLCGIWLLLGERPLLPLRALLAGIVWASLIITIPTFLIPLILLCAWLFLRRSDFRRAAVVFLAPVVLLVGGWCVRDYNQLHAFVSIASNSGFNLIIGNSENSTMNSGVYTDVSKYRVVGHRMSEVDADKYYTRAAKQWIAAHPRRALTLYGEKVIQYFSFSERMETDARGISLADHFLRTLIMLVTYEPLLLLFFLRIALYRKFPLSETEWLLVALYLLNSLLSSVYFPRIRFRLPLDWVMIMLDAQLIALAFVRQSKSAVEQTTASRQAIAT